MIWEYFIYIVAAVLAGVGTGLAGLSAATVMVPLLIVLCPSFSGETGAYQATAIALASDILGSAVSAATYIRHKNIDLKRGWIMLACIVSMCTLGSFAAWKAGNVVLGSFTLFLTFCIGIRFLVKPDTQRETTVSKGEKLDAKGIAISLFFGLTIGFGTGFVGTGGGMMMLVVFTAFLGMDLKTAVGTSTFIMTFTALIASISHIVIHPAIVWDRWPVLILCMATATAASLYSARFANRVDSRTVGLVTGAILTVMGGALIILHYREYLARIPYIFSILKSFGHLLAFVIPAATILLTIHHFFVAIPKPIFRKMLHAVAFLCSTIVILLADNWQSAAVTLALFAVLIYPPLWILQRWSGFAELLTQKKPGEICRSLLLLFFTDAVLVAVSWGLFGSQSVAATAILMWGMGDAAAGLIGQRFGKHPTHLPLADPKKTWEGSLSMVAVSMLTGIVCLLCLTDQSLPVVLITALISSVGGAYTELITRNGDDTLTVPAVLTVLLLAFQFGAAALA